MIKLTILLLFGYSFSISLVNFTLNIFRNFSLIQRMSQLSSLSPERLKKQYSNSSTNLNRSKLYAPSRYTQPLKPQKSGFHDILNSIQSQIRQEAIQKNASPSPSPSHKQKNNLQKVVNNQLMKRQNSSKFKIKPLKRQDNDMVQFKQIFINSREQNLKVIQKLSYTQQNTKSIVKQYDKLLKFQRGQTAKTEQSQKIQDNHIKESYRQVIQLLESEENGGNFSKNVENNFYDSPIVMEVPNFNDATTFAPGARLMQSPSLPSNYKGVKDLKIKQLLLRAKTGTNSEDIQKQAHLSFYLGQVYAGKRRHKQALKFFKRFLGFAKLMQDRVGMAIGFNRVAICNYNCKEYEKSISFHNQNLKLLDHENCFIGFYNIGISYRKIKKPQQSLQYFEIALNWAQQRGQQQSECIAFGQIAVTYQYMQLYQQAVQKFQQSLVLCQKIKNKQLKLDNLWYILKISSTLKIKPLQQLKKITQDAFECAKQLGQMITLDTLRCNIGILNGSQLFLKQNNIQKQQYEIQQILQ